MKNHISIYFVFALIIACSVAPQAINYGQDTCEYCHMTIVDRQHGSELVTTKGRASKFDAIECMMNHMKTIDENTVELYLINDFNQPGKLVDATSATFIITLEIPSPMGAFLSGTAGKNGAETLQINHGGTLYTWDELINYFKETEGVLEL